MARKIKNPTSRTRTVELDGKSFTIEFNFHAYATMKELTGISLLLGWDEDAMDAKEYACLLYSGLITHHSDMELDACFHALRGENFVEVANALFAAYRASLPKPKENADPTKPIAKKK